LNALLKFDIMTIGSDLWRGQGGVSLGQSPDREAEDGPVRFAAHRRRRGGLCENRTDQLRFQSSIQKTRDRPHPIHEGHSQTEASLINPHPASTNVSRHLEIHQEISKPVEVQ
jgi:hypothetical protein